MIPIIKETSVKTKICCMYVLITSIAIAQMKPSAALASIPDEKVSSIIQGSNIWDVFQTRRSVRKFKPDAIPEDDIIKILDAARMAPTSGNQQPWKFLVVKDKNTITKMKDACLNRLAARYDKNNSAGDSKEQFEKKINDMFSNYFSAPVYIIVLTDNKSTYPGYNHWDGPMAAGYLMLAARALGYGTVFITDAIPDNITKEVLQIPDQYTRVCITPIGVPVEWPISPPKKRLEEFIVREKF
jgi:nitroreductase